MSEVTDKRLAIDLTALRQDVWRDLKEEVGNPTFADAPPQHGTNKVAWIDTATMAADGLTKRMKCTQLEELMSSGHLQVSFEKLNGSKVDSEKKNNGCENYVYMSMYS